MSYCSINYGITDNFKRSIDEAIQACKLDKNDDYWKYYYIPLERTNVDMNVETGDIVKCGNNFYFRMTYKNVQKYATDVQSKAYHAYRKQYLCRTMTEAINGTDFCFKMMGSDSPDSDVDISIFPKVLIPKDPSGQIRKIIDTYNAENKKQFGEQTMADVFDANLYFTNFLQVFKSDDVINVAMKGVKSDYSIGNISQGCFDSTFGITMNAKALYIPSVNNPQQREYAAHRFAKYNLFNVGLLQTSIESGVANKSLNNKLFLEQLERLFDKCRSNEEIIKGFMLDTEENYKQLLENYFIQRKVYFVDGMTDESVARDLLNTLSLATFLEDEAYHSQGAFLHVNAQKDWNLKLDINDYIDSIFENLGFMMEYNDMKHHVGVKPYKRYEKINKYYGRITDALSRIAELNINCQQQIKLNVKTNTKNAEEQDKKRKECSISVDKDKIALYEEMSKRMIINITDGIVDISNIKDMNEEQLNAVTKSMMKRTFHYMIEQDIQPYNYMTGGKKHSNVKIHSMNVASMVVPVIGGKGKKNNQ